MRALYVGLSDVKLADFKAGRTRLLMRATAFGVVALCMYVNEALYASRLGGR